MKETLIHDADMVKNFRSQQTLGTVYQSDEVRSTIRQTTDNVETMLNMAPAGTAHKGVVYDGVAKTTLKETTMSEVPLGQMGGGAAIGGIGAYQDEIYDLKVTQKETFVDEDYFGGADMGQGGGEGYKLASFDVKATMKQDQEEYFGIGGAAATGDAPTSYADIYNATTNGLRESALVVEHEPTNTGTKVCSGTESVNLVVSKMALENTDVYMPRKQQPSAQMPVESYAMGGFTKTKQNLRNDDRLDLEILEPFKKNPYTQSLNSF
jgi:hypothetical protein